MKTYFRIGSMLVVLLAIMTPKLQAEERSAARQGQVSAALLSQLGLGGLQVVSDETGQRVRGMAVVFGTPGTGFFVTDVNRQALLNSRGGALMSGQVRHDLTNHTTTIWFHPQGTKMLSK